MATPIDYIDYVCEKINKKWFIRYRKMFGEYCIYVNDKPIILVCDSTVYVGKIKELDHLLDEVGIPYKGAKERYIVDVENEDLFNKVISILDNVIPLK